MGKIIVNGLEIEIPDGASVSIIDGEGNKVSATLSINYPFGACFVAEGTGVLLNDEILSEM